MNNSIKQFANLIINFIDKTFLPLFDNKIPQISKAIDQWTHIKNYIYQNEQVQIWKFQTLLVNLPSKPISNDYLKLSSQQNNKTISSNRGVSYYENDPWKYRVSQTLQNLENDKNNSYTPSSLLSDPLKLDDKIQNMILPESFDNVLASFRKLCTNFQNNHKKLINDRQGYAH